MRDTRIKKIITKFINKVKIKKTIINNLIHKILNMIEIPNQMETIQNLEVNLHHSI